MKSLQDITIALILLFFAFHFTTGDYSDFAQSPPNTSDKIYYLWEASIFAGFAIMCVGFNKLLNQSLYANSWSVLAWFFVIRLVWEIIWVIYGLSIIMQVAERVLFILTLLITFYITFLPYLKKT